MEEAKHRKKTPEFRQKLEHFHPWSPRMQQLLSKTFHDGPMPKRQWFI